MSIKVTCPICGNEVIILSYRQVMESHNKFGKVEYDVGKRCPGSFQTFRIAKKNLLKEKDHGKNST